MPAPRTTARPAGSRPAGPRQRPPLSAPQAQALREALALHQALAARRPGGPPPATGRPTVARGVTSGTPVARKPAVRTSTTRTSTTRTPTNRTARPRPQRIAGRSRWSARLGALALSTVLLPALASLALPGSGPAGSGPHDVTTLALTARSTLLHQADRYQQLEQEVTRRRVVLQQARATEKAAAARVAARQAVVGATAAQLYRSAAADRYALPTVGARSSTPGDVFLRAAVRARAERSLRAAIGQAKRTTTVLAAAIRKVSAASSAVAAATARADAVLAEARAAVADLSPAVTIQLAALEIVPSTGAQRARDDEAVRRWQNYVHRLGAAGITPPPASDLADADNLPSGLSPVIGADHQPVPGVAMGIDGNRPITVLPAETVAAVSSALSQLGKPYAAGTAGPASYDCGGFVSASWLLAGYALPATPQQLWATGAAVPMAALQVGDLVFAPNGKDVGFYLGNGAVLGASAGTRRVGVHDLVAGSSAARVTLPAPARPNAPLMAAGRTGTCGAVSASGTVTPAWGGWSNGEIPNSALCRLGVAGHELRCDAAASYRAMSAAYAQAFGRPLCITDSYRSLTAQVQAFRAKPGLAAVPGTSNHGWALAVDLCAGVNVPGTPQSRWMAANAGRFGFVHPDWAMPGGEKPEPWHWEYGYLS